MTYNPLIPASTDRPSASQSQVLTNFTQANTIFTNNHYAFNDATVALRGKHRYMVMPNQGAGPATTATEGALYVKGGILFYRYPSSGLELALTSGAVPVTTTNGQTILPGGLILKWNQLTFAGLSTVANFPNGAFPTNALCTVVSPLNGNAATDRVYVDTWNAATVTIKRVSNSGNASVTYFAIGT